MAEETFKLNICAVLSMPRVGWNDAWGPIYDALSRMQISLQTFVGGLWHSELERAIDWCIENGFENVLTLDYDSMFTPWHLGRLLTQFNHHPEFGAMAAMQCRRGDRLVLFSITDAPDQIEIRHSEPLAVDTAHFGLTVINLKQLREIPKPWFEPKPGPAGDWGRGTSLDADISFWQKWRAAGKTIGMCADVRIGHLEVMVSYMDKKLEPQWCTVSEWHRMAGTPRIGHEEKVKEPETACAT